MSITQSDNKRICEKMLAPTKKTKIPPQVRQTLTSKYRMLKANPLLMYELEKKLDSSGISKEEQIIKPPLKTLAAVLDADCKVPIYNNSICNKSILKTSMQQNKSNIASQGRPQKKTITVKKTEPVKHEKPIHHFHVQKKNLSLKNVPRKESSQSKEKIFLKNVNNTLNTYSVVEKKDHIKNTKPAVANVNILSFSARKSTALNESVNRQSRLPCSEMAKRLSDWLKQKGKNLGEYHHLKCFGVHAQNNIKVDSSDAEKENSVPNITNEIEIDKNTNSVEKVNLSAIAQDALIDLHKLILEGYPPKQCEIWLKLIKQKHRQVEEEPQYWECRAALEQTKGNINLAVECYKTAIIQGAEVQNVDKYLDQLLHKFSLLNISNDTDLCVNKERFKIVEEARNIFKSSIIQFAVQERVFRKKNKDGVTIEKKMFATPVRRSTRLSRCAYTSTPGVHIYSSLQDVDSALRGTLNFQCNNALKE